MKTFHIQGQSGASIIQVGSALAEIGQWLPLSRTVIVTVECQIRVVFF